jgi:SAM-dependent methyltransferase
MSVEVLRSGAEIDDARRELRRRGWSSLSAGWRTAAAAWGLKLPGVPVGDGRKSWDVLKTLRFLDEGVAKDAAILDIGCYGSEVICSLPRMGYRRLHGLDLDPGVRRMPHSDAIDYRVGNFMEAPFPPGTFQAITAISVIEHGFDGPRMLAEMSRLLAPGGCFIASFDYWPEKIETGNIRLFGLDWRIFSAPEVTALLDQAKAFGMRAHGEARLDARERPIHFAGRDYTFGWLALRKDDAPSAAKSSA